jgi:hypothetical protein
MNMKDEYPISSGSALDERRGPHDDSREILVKTPGNNSSLRLNAKPRTHREVLLWEVTLPFEAPRTHIKQNNEWISFRKSNADISLIEVISKVIEEQLVIG